MALVNPPSYLQQGSYPALNDRLTNQAIFATSGIIGTTSLAVTQNGTPNMSVNVAAGWAGIVGNYTTGMGVYLFYNDATVNLTVTTANATLPRIDRVVATINDAYYSGLLNSVTLSVVAGTPNASPVAPATPTNSISLATLSIPALDTAVLTADITDTRTVTSTNMSVWTTALRPSAPSTGSFGFNTTLLQFEYYDGSTWQGVSGGGGGFDPFLLMGA